ncbi:MAG: transposase [Candidatus Eremiobacteraeota bacterium]|nr:transposase [Candidatus Eremiobacteraeota bacterium]MCW5869353.1 transposase [Candidatus Eremiobacteraeota bacterium]
MRYADGDGFLTKLGELRRFGNPRQLMSYLGMVPSFHQSGDTNKSRKLLPPARAYPGELELLWSFQGRKTAGSAAEGFTTVGA